MFSQYQTLNSSVFVFFAFFCKWRPPFKQGETLIFLGVPHGKLLHINFISQVLCIALLLFFFKFYVVCHFHFIFFSKLRETFRLLAFGAIFRLSGIPCYGHSVIPCCRFATKNARFCKKSKRTADGEWGTEENDK